MYTLQIYSFSLLKMILFWLSIWCLKLWKLYLNKVTDSNPKDSFLTKKATLFQAWLFISENYPMKIYCFTNLKDRMALCSSRTFSK